MHLGLFWALGHHTNQRAGGCHSSLCAKTIHQHNDNDSVKEIVNPQSGRTWKSWYVRISEGMHRRSMSPEITSFVGFGRQENK